MCNTALAQSPQSLFHPNPLQPSSLKRYLVGRVLTQICNVIVIIELQKRLIGPIHETAPVATVDMLIPPLPYARV
jgi:hypothetical protein